MTHSPQLVTYNWAGPIAIVNRRVEDSVRQLALAKDQPVAVRSLPLPLTHLPADQCLTESVVPSTIGEVQAITCSYADTRQAEAGDWGAAGMRVPQVVIGRGIIHLDPEAQWSQPLLRRQRQWVQARIDVTSVISKYQAWWHGLGRLLGVGVPEPLRIATQWRLDHLNLPTGSPRTDTTASGATPCYIELTD